MFNHMDRDVRHLQMEDLTATIVLGGLFIVLLVITLF